MPAHEATSQDPKYIIHPDHVLPKDDKRVRQWGLDTMKKYEYLFKPDTPNLRVVCRDAVSAEEIDIRNIYPFKDLNFFIHRQGKGWFLTLMTRGTILARLGYLKV